MSSENKIWETLKADYLNKVEEALSSVRHPHIAEVLEDVQSHLDERFATLEPEEQTRKNLEDILSEMGPAAEYPELLASNVISSDQKVRPKYLLWISFAIVIVIAVILSPKLISPKIKEHKLLTISKAYWFHSDQRPSSIPSDAVPKDDDGHMLFHVDEWFEGTGNTEQYRSFLNQVDKRFILKADGYPDIQANAERGCWSREFYIRIPKSEYVKMVPGISYTIHPVNSNPKYQWKVIPDVTICEPNK